MFSLCLICDGNENTRQDNRANIIEVAAEECDLKYKLLQNFSTLIELEIHDNLMNRRLPRWRDNLGSSVVSYFNACVKSMLSKSKENM